MLNRELIGPSLFLVLFTLYALVAWQIPLMPFEEYESVTSATLPKVYAVFGIVVCVLSIGANLLKQAPAEKAEPKPPLPATADAFLARARKRT